VFLEKAWAKVNTNYETMLGSKPSDVLKFLTNIPTMEYNISEHDVKFLNSLISESL
jgi:hypothetical protein